MAMCSGNGKMLCMADSNGLYMCDGGALYVDCVVYTNGAGNRHYERLRKAKSCEVFIGDECFNSPEKCCANYTDVDHSSIEFTHRRTKQKAMKILGDGCAPAEAVYDTMAII
jgi:hypothetical protein